MAFNKNWIQWIVTKGEPFKIMFLDRKYRGGPPTTVFQVSDDDGAVTFNGDFDLSDNDVTLPANTVTGDNLTNALAAQIPMTATLSVGALTSDHRDVTIQVKDAGGTNMALVGRYDVWVSGSAKGTPIGTSTTGLTTSVQTGTLALTKLANLDFEILSDASGVIVVRVLDAAGTETRYVNISVGGVVYASAAVVTT